MAKEKPAPQQSAAAPQPAPRGLLHRLARFPAWLKANPGRAGITLLGLTAAIIVLGVGLTLILDYASKPSYVKQLAQVFSDFDKGKYTASRQVAAKLLTDNTVGYAEHGGAYFILGAVTLRDADEQINPV